MKSSSRAKSCLTNSFLSVKWGGCRLSHIAALRFESMRKSLRISSSAPSMSILINENSSPLRSSANFKEIIWAPSSFWLRIFVALDPDFIPCSGPIIRFSLLFETQALTRNQFDIRLLLNCEDKRWKKFTGFGSTILIFPAPKDVAMKAVGPTHAPMSRKPLPLIKFLLKKLYVCGSHWSENWSQNQCFGTLKWWSFIDRT